MHRKIALFLMCSLLAATVQAGPGPGRFARKASLLKKKIVTRTLQQRADASYSKALSKLHKQKTDFLLREFPVNNNSVHWEEVPFHAKDLYPDIPFLTNNKQAQLYLQHRINSEIIKDIEFHNKLYTQVQNRLEDFARTQVKPTHSPAEDVAWLANQIPTDTSYLLLGEYHGVADIPSTVTALIRTLRAQQPGREIFLFTELIYHKTHTVVNDFYEKMFTDIESDQALNVHVIGLDMEMADSQPTVIGQDGAFIRNIDFWTTREGLRLRNNYWLKILKQYRAQNPDALFIVYGGVGHMGYTYPYSIGNAFQEDKTFVISFYLDYHFDELTDGHFLHNRIVRFNDKELSRLAGFDVLIRGGKTTFD